MILFGGIPDIYFDKLKEVALKRLSSVPFTGVGLRSMNDKYIIDHEYCEDLVDTLTLYCENRPNCLSEGLGVVMLQRPWEAITFEESFWPFALYRRALIDVKLTTKGEGQKRSANIYADRAVEIAIQLQKTVRKITTIYESELKRTPFLLPLRSFSSQTFGTLLRKVHDSIQDQTVLGPTIQ
jgi:hypothetical protein